MKMCVWLDDFSMLSIYIRASTDAQFKYEACETFSLVDISRSNVASSSSSSVLSSSFMTLIKFEALLRICTEEVKSSCCLVLMHARDNNQIKNGTRSSTTTTTASIYVLYFIFIYTYIEFYILSFNMNESFFIRM